MKRPSSTSALPEPVFFTDRDLGKTVPRVLRQAGLAVERHDDHFDDTTFDEEWLSEVGKRGWVVLTHNRRIRYNSRETAALMEAGVRAFFLIGHTTHLELAENFVRTLESVYRFLARHRGPFLAKVYRPSGTAEPGRSGRVEMWLSYEEWAG